VLLLQIIVNNTLWGRHHDLLSRHISVTGMYVLMLAYFMAVVINLEVGLMRHVYKIMSALVRKHVLVTCFINSEGRMRLRTCSVVRVGQIRTYPHARCVYV
jgi:hypothetical protein